MKKKSDGMSPDMFHDATSSTPIPVFTSINDKNETKNLLQNETEDLTSVNLFTLVPINEGNKNETHNLLQNEAEHKSIQNELIKIDFDKQTVSARELHAFFELGERFSKWWQRMVLYGLEKDVDFTTVPFGTVVNQGV